MVRNDSNDKEESYHEESDNNSSTNFQLQLNESIVNESKEVDKDNKANKNVLTDDIEINTNNIKLY